MSAFIEWIDSRIAKMRYFDIAATKLAVLLFALFLVKLWPPLASLDWRWYLGLSFVVALPIIFRIFEKASIQIAYIALWGVIYLAVEFLTKL